MSIEILREYLDEKTYNILHEANKFCSDLISQSKSIIKNLLTVEGVSLSDICFVAVGSIGRGEALYASDVDIIPVLKDNRAFNVYETKDAQFRINLSKKLGLPVSKGTNLTKCIDVDSLSDPETIGGD